MDVVKGLPSTTEEDLTAEDERIVAWDLENIVDDVSSATGADDDGCVMEVVTLLVLLLTVVVDMDGTVL